MRRERRGGLFCRSKQQASADPKRGHEERKEEAVHKNTVNEKTSEAAQKT
jgi:hypothetical protein